MATVKLQTRPIDSDSPRRDAEETDVLVNPRTGVETVALTAKDAATVDATYGAEEQGVIDNNRTRIEEIEQALKDFGILPQ